jgi:hypothetical protein
MFNQIHIKHTDAREAFVCEDTNSSPLSEKQCFLPHYKLTPILINFMITGYLINPDTYGVKGEKQLKNKMLQIYSLIDRRNNRVSSTP